MNSTPPLKKAKPNLQHLLQAFPDWFLRFSAEEQIISLTLYRLLTKAQPVAKHALAEEAGITIDIIEKLLKSWAGVYFNESNEVIGYWGLSVVEMPHKFIVANKTLYTWCAWDALFIPSLIQKTAIVESTCPITKQNITLTVTPDCVKNVKPATTMVTFIEPPNSEKIHDDVISHFCHYVHFISSVNEIENWEAEKKGKFLYLTLEEAFELGRMKNQKQYANHIN